MPTSFALTYDYRCPFASNLHLHVIEALRAGAEFEVQFLPWSLNQNHRDEGAPDVWDDPEREPQLVALAAGVSVRDQQRERFLDAHEALFLARHVHGVRLNTFEQVAVALGAVGVDVDAVEADLATRRPHQVIAESHRALDRYEVFGVPTIIVNDQSVFVRYMERPNGTSGAESVSLIERLVTMARDDVRLNEFKHTTRSN